MGRPLARVWRWASHLTLAAGVMMGMAGCSNSTPAPAPAEAPRAAEGVPAPAPPASPGLPSPTDEMMKRVRGKWTGDLDGMIQRRLIRVLTTYSKTTFFLDKGTQLGLV